MTARRKPPPPPACQVIIMGAKLPFVPVANRVHPVAAAPRKPLTWYALAGLCLLGSGLALLAIAGGAAHQVG